VYRSKNKLRPPTFPSAGEPLYLGLQHLLPLFNPHAQSRLKTQTCRLVQFLLEDIEGWKPRATPGPSDHRIRFLSGVDQIVRLDSKSELRFGFTFTRETLLARYARQGCSNRVLGKEVRLRATELARSYRTQTGQSTQTMHAKCRLRPFRCPQSMPLFRM
jgi:hypothetical protein